MAYLKERFHLYGTKQSFNENNKAGLINPDSVCFIEDTGQIATQGSIFSVDKKDYAVVKSIAEGNRDALLDILGVEGSSVGDGKINNLPEIEYFLGGYKPGEDTLKNCLANLKNSITDTIGKPNGIAPLDNDAKIPSVFLPSYVDDVLEFNSLTKFPAIGETGKIYVALDTDITYRWSGSTYVEISKSIGLGETPTTAYPGDKGKENAENIEYLTDNFIPTVKLPSNLLDTDGVRIDITEYLSTYLTKVSMAAGVNHSLYLTIDDKVIFLEEGKNYTITHDNKGILYRDYQGNFKILNFATSATPLKAFLTIEDADIFNIVDISRYVDILEMIGNDSAIDLSDNSVVNKYFNEGDCIKNVCFKCGNLLFYFNIGDNVVSTLYCSPYNSKIVTISLSAGYSPQKGQTILLSFRTKLASTTREGLMSAEDKIKVDNIIPTIELPSGIIASAITAGGLTLITEYLNDYLTETVSGPASIVTGGTLSKSVYLTVEDKVMLLKEGEDYSSSQVNNSILIISGNKLKRLKVVIYYSTTLGLQAYLAVDDVDIILPTATSDKDGFMSSEDKVKLDSFDKKSLVIPLTVTFDELLTNGTFNCANDAVTAEAQVALNALTPLSDLKNFNLYFRCSDDITRPIKVNIDNVKPEVVQGDLPHNIIYITINYENNFLFGYLSPAPNTLQIGIIGSLQPIRPMSASELDTILN